MTKNKHYIFLLLFLLPLISQAQLPRINVEGFFLRDSVELGKTLKYILLSKHDPQAEVVFPDSTFTFTPFELVRKEFYPTRTVNGRSTDSTVYVLRTFQLQPVQRLQLQARLFFQGDTLLLTAHADSVFLIQHVKSLPEPLPLRSATQLLPVAEEFNYLYWGLGLVAAGVLFGGIWGLFGKSIRTRYRLYVLQKDQSQFQYRFQTATDRFKRLKTLEPLERAITLWKNYLTKLEDEEISSFTTKEITTFYADDERVANTLKVCDRAIYGNIISDDESEVVNALSQLAAFAAYRYVTIRDSIRNVANTR
ncbi:hypothetical protein [Rufibacter quisquiliarum]|uniref:DUF4129 domain-containing protein n=1 Tax=Rufibacter quisquiliarum TaxID=1549639 RepID=A0A839GRK3_9BACT|nr:hypothetical protein [Rufibacter quisquiliarum]MBA9077476.1 hypothetical protein [Rufibacter quisquiliarum]